MRVVGQLHQGAVRGARGARRGAVDVVPRPRTRLRAAHPRPVRAHGHPTTTVNKLVGKCHTLANSSRHPTTTVTRLLGVVQQLRIHSCSLGTLDSFVRVFVDSSTRKLRAI